MLMSDVFFTDGQTTISQYLDIIDSIFASESAKCWLILNRCFLLIDNYGLWNEVVQQTPAISVYRNKWYTDMEYLNEEYKRNMESAEALQMDIDRCLDTYTNVWAKRNHIIWQGDVSTLLPEIQVIPGVSCYMPIPEWACNHTHWQYGYEITFSFYSIEPYSEKVGHANWITLDCEGIDLIAAQAYAEVLKASGFIMLEDTKYDSYSGSWRAEKNGCQMWFSWWDKSSFIGLDAPTACVVPAPLVYILEMKSIEPEIS